MQITDEAMRAIVAKAIFDNMSTEMKEGLLIKAVANLIEPQKNSYGQPLPSHLQQQFTHATAVMSANIVQEMFAADPAIKERLAKVVSEALGKMFDGEDNLRRLSDAIARGFRESFGDR